MNRILLTASNEGIVKSQKPSVLISELPELNFTEDLRKKNIIVTEAYGVEKKIRQENFNYTNNLYKKFILELPEQLNNFHKQKYSKKYWEIIIGHWLGFYIKVIFNKFKNLEEAIEKYDVDETLIQKNIEEKIYPYKDIKEFAYSSNDDYWHFYLYSKILKANNFFKLRVTEIDYMEKRVNNKSQELLISEPYRGENLKIKMIKKLFNLFKIFKNDNDAFLINTYLPTKEVIKLQLLLKQFPQLWELPKNLPIFPSYNLEERKKINFKLTTSDNIEKFIRNDLPRSLPISYLEGYTSLLKISENLNWPKKPKFIFTSGAFERNEIFKVWLAQKVFNGSKYFTGQHGHGYHTHLEKQKSVEIATSDHFLSWGAGDNTNEISTFNFKVLNRKRKWNKDGHLLIVVYRVGQSLWTWNRKGINKIYFEWLTELLKLLPEHIKKKTIIRFAFESQSKNIEHNYNFIKKNFSEFEIDEQNKNFDNLLQESRLTLYNYDSTGILENLTSNLPVKGFWPHTFDHLNSKAETYYQDLVKAEILHTNVKSVAESIKKNWSDIDLWWSNIETQNIRKKFCNIFSKEPSPKSLEKLSKIFLKNV